MSKRIVHRHGIHFWGVYISLLTFLSVIPPVVAAAVDQRGAWAVDPNNPGEDLPPQGRSLFDILFTAETETGRVYDIPFPFTKLIRKIEVQLPRDSSGNSTLKKGLIPLGRSLQRNAAAPDFFKYPRVVVAVDTEPEVTHGRRPMLMKDRLFLGYQEKSNIVEVISYNEFAGRFEYQVVRDYGPGLQPKVRYANRTLCMSCHQNGGPIFSRAAWDETNASSEISDRLLREKPVFYGVAVNPDSIVAIDNATDRANLIAAYQRLWREGCGGDRRDAIRCRAGVLTAALQYRLSAFSQFDPNSPLYRDYSIPVLTQNWRDRWRGGLYIPDPDIPNRAPLLTLGGTEIRSAPDPLIMRPPRETWTAERDLHRVVIGVAALIPAADIRRLDTHLFEHGLQANAARQHFQGPCEFIRRGTLGAGDLISLKCRMADSANSAIFDLRADLHLEAGRVASHASNWLSFSDEAEIIGFAHSGAPVLADGNHWTVTLGMSQRQNGLHIRLSNGSVLEGMRIRWQRSAAERDLLPRAQQFAGDALVTVMHDFAPLYDAIADMVQQSDQKPLGVFSAQTFRGTKAMQTLLSQLGLAPTKWCCDDVSQLPPARVDAIPEAVSDRLRDTLPSSGALRTFYRHCATCHQTEARFPPGFLHGDARQVAANLAQCAPRIFFRLHMWQVDAGDRTKSPMPPVNALQAFNYSVQAWRESPDLAGLMHYIQAVLAGQQGNTRSPEELLANGYDQTPACLPEPG